jgi:hypothetical protein
VNTTANDKTNIPNKDWSFVAFFKVSNLPGARYRLTVPVNQLAEVAFSLTPRRNRRVCCGGIVMLAGSHTVPLVVGPSKASAGSGRGSYSGCTLDHSLLVSHETKIPFLSGLLQDSP